MIQCSSVSFGRLVCLNLFCKLVQGFMTIDRGSSPVLYCIASDTHTTDTLLEGKLFGSRFIARIARGSPPLLLCASALFDKIFMPDTHTADTLLEAILFGSRFIARIARGSPSLLLCASALFDKILMPDMCRSALISYGPAVSICRVSIRSHGMPDGGSAILVGRISIPWWY